MEKITIGTTQNVDIEYEIAGVGERIAASILDILIVIGYMLVVGFVFLILGLNSYRYGESNTTLEIVRFIIYLPVFFYNLIFEIFMNGQTPGKSVLKIKVIRTDGRQPTLGNYFMRWVLRLFDMVLLFGEVALITVVVNGKGQRLGDIAAGTMVIKMKSRQQLGSSAFVKIDDNYSAVFPEAMRLSDKDASIIKQVLRLTVNDAEDIVLIEGKLTEKLKSFLGIQSSLADRAFLQTVLKDYNFTSGRV